MTPNAKDIATLIELFASSGWDELHVETGGLQLFLSTDPNARLTSGEAATPAPRAPAPLAPAPLAAAAPPVAASQPAPEQGEPLASWKPVKAPNLGTFYRSPKPGAPPFVEVGQAVTADMDICLLEVMKLFTSVKAGVAGVVRQVCVPDGDLVEGDQILFYIE